MPAFPLKTYQRQALDALDVFLRQARAQGVAEAWAHAVQRERLPPAPYRDDGVGADVPVVCLKIPTGGGKTLMAAHAIGRMASAMVERPHPVALWLVPSDAIRQQTLAGLQTPGHPYRAPLEDAYGSALTVCALDQLHTVPAQDWGRRTIVAVATIQSLRIKNKDGRRAYAMSEAWEPHFRSLDTALHGGPASGQDSLTAEDVRASGGVLGAEQEGRPKRSLVNWLALQRPLVVVDEAHNAKSNLSLDLLKNLRPACVLDLTATPLASKTNVLYRISARELEAEAMIKLPVLVAEHGDDWQAAVRDALLRRKQLEVEAAREPDYVRPIALFQAQDKTGAATVDVLHKHLIEVERVPAEQIARVTGAHRELDDVDLSRPGPIRCVITVDALRAGWDCPFAYVLCSLQNLASNQAVEQLLGRVLRMPYARRRASPPLNRAYAHVLAKSFGAAANALVDRMAEQMGFDAVSAAAAVLPDDGGLFGELSFDAPSPTVPTLELMWNSATHAADALRLALADQPDVEVVDESGAAPVLRLTGEVSDAQRDAITAMAAPADRALIAARFDQHAARLQAARAPADRGTAFAPVPRLCVLWQGTLDLIERETLSELVAFDLLAADPRPELPGFNVVEQSSAFEVYLGGERMLLRAADAAQMTLDGVAVDATEADLVRALERELRRPGLTQTETQVYIQRAVTWLLREQGISLTGLTRGRLALVQALARRIDEKIAGARADAFQRLMFDGLDDARLTHDPLHRFRFAAGRYPVRDSYRGRYQFGKHYFAEVGSLKSQGEEHDCAVAIDQLDAVRHWVRNLERQQDFAFWLPTATDYFYPDFVAELMDGRILVVEYKGDAYVSNDDSREKRLVGEAWATRTGQRFVMVERLREGLDMSAQLRKAIESRP